MPMSDHDSTSGSRLSDCQQASLQKIALLDQSELLDLLSTQHVMKRIESIFLDRTVEHVPQQETRWKSLICSPSNPSPFMARRMSNSERSGLNSITSCGSRLACLKNTIGFRICLIASSRRSGLTFFRTSSIKCRLVSFRFPFMSSII